MATILHARSINVSGRDIQQSISILQTINVTCGLSIVSRHLFSSCVIKINHASGFTRVISYFYQSVEGMYMCINSFPKAER